MKNVLHLVDDVQYVNTNCFQHQLAHTMRAMCNVTTIPYAQLSSTKINKDYDVVISTLKQRTLYNNIDVVARFLDGVEVVVYDQDPWESYIDGSQYSGSYSVISSKLNLSFFALTTKWWADFVNSKGIPAKFVRMWMLPSYCSATSLYDDRHVDLGFIGQAHSYRKTLFDYLEQRNYPITHLPRQKYKGFLDSLSTMKVFIHNENAPIIVDGKHENLSTGLWIKDVEAAARGAFSIRNAAVGAATYLEGIETVRLYSSMDEIPGILEEIRGQDAVKRQNMIDKTVQHIKTSDFWRETVTILTE